MSGRGSTRSLSTGRRSVHRSPSGRPDRPRPPEAAGTAHDPASVVGPDGWSTWASLTDRVDRKTVAAWVAAGKLDRLQPGVYALAALTGSWRIRLEGAVAGSGAVVGHRSALAL